MQYKNIKESSELLPQPMESIQDLINELVQTFSMDFNLGKDQTKAMMPYCRTAIEKYIYQKIGDNVTAMYQFKCKEDNSKFRENQENLLLGYENKFDVDARREMMEFLGVKPRFQLQASLTGSGTSDPQKISETKTDYSTMVHAQPPPLLSNSFRGRNFLTSTAGSGGNGAEEVGISRSDSMSSDVVFRTLKSN